LEILALPAETTDRFDPKPGDSIQDDIVLVRIAETVLSHKICQNEIVIRLDAPLSKGASIQFMRGVAAGPHYFTKCTCMLTERPACSQYVHFGSHDGIEVPFTRVVMTALMATFLKIAARISAIGTLILAVLILGSQVRSWLLTDEWDSFPISRALSLAHLERPAIYVTASVSDRPPPSLDLQAVSDWFLDLSAGGFLLAVAAVLLGFSIVGASMEKRFGTTDK
jgi:hypothetical protein